MTTSSWTATGSPTVQPTTVELRTGTTRLDVKYVTDVVASRVPFMIESTRVSLTALSEPLGP